MPRGILDIGLGTIINALPIELYGKSSSIFDIIYSQTKRGVSSPRTISKSSIQPLRMMSGSNTIPLQVLLSPFAKLRLSKVGMIELPFYSPLKLPYEVIQRREGPNDGLVSVKSATWGEFLGTGREIRLFFFILMYQCL